MNSENQPAIVDVRSPEEFEGMHVPGAINIPLDEIPGRINEFARMSRPIIAYCRSGNRSAMAAAILKQNGIREVENGGGLDDMLERFIKTEI